MGHHFQDRSATNPSLPLRPCSVAERAERKRGTCCTSILKVVLSGDRLSDLKTCKNTLSIWSYKNEEEKKDALVALAANRNNIQKLQYIILEKEELEKLGLSIQSEQGECKCLEGKSPEILGRHYNIVNLDYWQLGFLAEHITKRVKEIKDDNLLSSHQLTEKKVKELIKLYAESNRLDIDKLSPDIKNKL